MDLLNKILIKFKALRFFDRTKRRQFRKDSMEAYFKRKLERLRSQAIWGVSYSVFDGEELLGASIKSIRGAVQYVNVMYSTLSWYGEAANPTLLKTLNDLKDEGLIDELIEYEPDLEKQPVSNEIEKRNAGLEAAMNFGCTYFMPMDTDEFYREPEVIQAQELILTKGITHAYCGIVDYINSSCERVIETTPLAVPFFSRLTKTSKLVFDQTKVPTVTDPTRNLSHYRGAKYYVLFSVAMHHMSCIRNNLAKKMRNSTNPIMVKCSENMVKLKNDLDSVAVALVPDEFHIGKYNR